MIQLIFHLIGDYVTQSDWMAQNKTKSTFAAFCHATVYSLPFLLIASVNAWFVIWSTHLLIDRFRLARYVCWLKNFLSPPTLEGFYVPRLSLKQQWWHPWAECSGTGYHKDSPPWLSVWLMIAADNTIHLAINELSLRFL
jgi:hypothetical protein